MKPRSRSWSDHGWQVTHGASWLCVVMAMVPFFSVIVTVRADDLMPLFSPASLETKTEVETKAGAETRAKPASVPATPAQPQSASRSTIPATSPASPASPVPTGNAFETQEFSNELQRQKEERFRELKRQLEILSQLTQPPAKSPPQAVTTRKTQNPETPESRPAESNTSPHKPEPEVTPLPQLEKTPSEPKPSTSSETPDHQEQASAESPAVPATLVVEGTIDRFSLATSLFGTGQTEVCLDVLKHTDLTSLSREDQIWAEYLQACCHRRAGRNDLAQQSFRRILAEKDADWIGHLARWWLDDLDAKAKLKSDIARLSETLTAWEAEIDTLARQTTRTATAQ